MWLLLHRRLFVALLSALVFNICCASETLGTNQSIANGGYIQSPGGLYTLAMQSDGKLLVYRSDGSVRYSMATNGSFAVMQGDGNFVEYNSAGQALWSTGTNNGLNNRITIQDDGDLVVYLPGPSISRAWSLGTDPAFGDPTKVGDVLGRDLAFTGAGYLGHLGIWDGNQVFNAGPPSSGNNAIHINSLFEFKHTVTNTGSIATYWGTASFKIPSGQIVMTGCWEPICTNYGGTVSADARYSVALRLMQMYRIGADYTSTAYYTRARAQGNGYPMVRGVYRCDTMVIDALQQSTFYGPYSNSPHTAEQNAWIARWANLDSGVKTPGAIYDKLKTFQ